ncbi:MAG: hypothetical protein ABL876_02525 [Chitinophagaceae bacterium]
MKTERSNIEHPMWRKKVDTVLLERQHTPIPNWLSKLWLIKNFVGLNTSKKEVQSEVTINFQKIKYQGWITYARYQQKDPLYKLFISKELAQRLKDSFVMSYMRTLEWRLRKLNNYKGSIEEEIPFWEFLDIEFDNEKKQFFFTAHYFQKPLFPELFKQFVKSHILKDIENRLSEKGDFKFIKEDWLSKKEFKTFLARKNIIYYLLDSKNHLLYIGEAQHSSRIPHARPEIPNWDYFRVDCLPEWLSRGERLELERLVIRSFASVLTNMKGIKTQKISDYTLMNRKIDS